MLCFSINMGQLLSSGTRYYLFLVYLKDSLLIVGDANDAFWLAQVFYGLGQFTRAQGVLMQQNLLNSSTACRYLAALCLVC